MADESKFEQAKVTSKRQSEMLPTTKNLKMKVKRIKLLAKRKNSLKMPKIKPMTSLII